MDEEATSTISHALLEPPNQLIPPILLVDDDPLILKALELTLKTNHSVLTAQNGQAAIHLMENTLISIIICDLRLPDMNGIEVLQKAIALQPSAIRMMLTGSTEVSIAVNAINVGQVSQFILKPWDTPSLLQTISTAIEKYKLQLENRRLYELISEQHKTLSQTHESLRQELQLGGRIHELLLLGHAPTDVPGIDIIAKTWPSKDVDGDFFDFYHPSEHILDIVVGDVMGKGIPAALVGTAMKTQLTRFAMPYTHSHIYDKNKFWQQDILHPIEILSLVHQEIASQLMKIEYFVSLFYGRFDLQQRTLTYVDCGFTKPIHYQHATQNISSLNGQNFPMGMVPFENYRSTQALFDQGDIFVFYSDGITETRSPEGQFFGKDNLETLVKKNATLNPEALIALIKTTVSHFSKKEYFDDDFTIIIVKINTLPLSVESTCKTAKFSSDLSQLKAVRDFIKRFCSETSSDSQKLSEPLQLAVNEAFCNIVNHGYDKKPGHQILIKGECNKDGILFDIADQGKYFDPSKIDEPDLSGRQDNGFGLYMIRQLADELHYIPKSNEANWNHLRIFKYFRDKKASMKMTSQTKDQLLIITLEGESLDAKEVPQFKQQIQDLLLNQDSNQLIFDLHHLQFIDSSGLGSFLSIFRKLTLKGGSLKLASMTNPIRSMFELVCMHKIFEIYNTTEEAIRSFEK